MRLFVTGGAGFIGSNYVRHWSCATSDDDVTVLRRPHLRRQPREPRRRRRRPAVRGSYTATSATVERPCCGDGGPRRGRPLRRREPRRPLDRRPGRASSARTASARNVLCDVARRVGVDRFLHISTDEVYGSIDAGLRSPRSRPLLGPARPTRVEGRAATSSRSAYHEHLRPAGASSRAASNNFGPYQFPEKVIPLFATNLLDGRPVPLYGDGGNVRDWIHVDDHCRAVDLVLRAGPGRRDLQHRRRQRDRNRRADIAELLGADRSRRASFIEPVARPPRPRPSLLRRPSTRSRRSAGAPSIALRRRRWPRTVDWYRGQPGLVGAAAAAGAVAERTAVGRDSVACVSRHRRRRASSAATSCRPASGPATTWSALDHGPSSTSPTATRCSGAVTTIAARRRRPRRGVDGGRRLRGRSRHGPSPPTPSPCAGWPRPAAAPAPTSCTSRPTTCSRASRPTPYTEWDATGSARSVYGRSKLAGEREALRRARRHRRAHVVGVRRARREHGEDDPAPRRRAGSTLAFVDDQRGHPTFTADLAPMLRRLAVDRRPGRPPRHQPGRGDLVRVRPGGARGRRPRPDAGAADRHGRPAAAPRRRPPGQLGARQRRAAASAACRCSPTSTSRSARVVRRSSPV